MLIKSEFKPVWWLRNKHLQTAWQKYSRKGLNVTTVSQELDLPDGDFIDINWTEKPQADSTTPMVIVFHGLEGSVNSEYAKGMLRTIVKRGWTGVLMHFRGCSGRVNRLPRAYHSGETTDPTFFINWLEEHFPKAPKFAVGFSLGGNVLTKYMGEMKNNTPLKASSIISAPLDLAASCKAIMQGSSRVYQKYLLDLLKNKFSRKLKAMDLSKYIHVKEDGIWNIQSIWEFDDKITAPLHGFKNAMDYYLKSSGKPFIKSIKKPTLFIHSKDDPFLSQDAIPVQEELSETVRFELSEHGGHVGFVSKAKEFWAEQRTCDFFQAQLSLANIDKQK
jgi:predicted alpha/beta-fold hydrolase